jgi:hypothetical protein
MIKMVKVVTVKALDSMRLQLRFSDGSEGVFDLSELLREGGPMIEPLRDPEVFAKVFVQTGVPTWPNGFDLDAIKLYMDLETAGQLKKPVSAK